MLKERTSSSVKATKSLFVLRFSRFAKVLVVKFATKVIYQTTDFRKILQDLGKVMLFLNVDLLFENCLLIV